MVVFDENGVVFDENGVVLDENAVVDALDCSSMTPL